MIKPDELFRFTGLWVPLVTPMKNKTIDFAALERLLTWLLEHPIDGIVLGGTTGEGLLLSPEELDSLVVATLALIGNRCPVVTAVHGISTAATIESVQFHSRRAVTGLMVSAPHYIRPTQHNLRGYFLSLAQATHLPFIVYNNPRRTGVNIEPDTLRQMSEYWQFRTVKQASTALDDLDRLLCNPLLDVLCGEDHLLEVFLTKGAHGAMSVIGHLEPDLLIRMIRKQPILSNGLNATDKEALTMARGQLDIGPNPAALKYRLAQRGLLHNELRAPLEAINLRETEDGYLTLKSSGSNLATF